MHMLNAVPLGPDNYGTGLHVVNSILVECAEAGLAGISRCSTNAPCFTADVRAAVGHTELAIKLDHRSLELGVEPAWIVFGSRVGPDAHRIGGVAQFGHHTG